MDNIVAQAMARWPDVPAVYGWLRLDRRGRWLVKGEPIGHRPTIGFINRNYHSDARGRYYFQNGPQRVFVDLDQCPFVLSLVPARLIPGQLTPPRPGSPMLAALVTHLGEPVTAARRGWVDAQAGVVIEFEHGLGSVLDRDLPALVECFLDGCGDRLDEQGWADALAGSGAQLTLGLDCGPIPMATLPHAAGAAPFDFISTPRPDPDEDACT